MASHFPPPTSLSLPTFFTSQPFIHPRHTLDQFSLASLSLTLLSYCFIPALSVSFTPLASEMRSIGDIVSFRSGTEFSRRLCISFRWNSSISERKSFSELSTEIDWLSESRNRELSSCLYDSKALTSERQMFACLWKCFLQHDPGRANAPQDSLRSCEHNTLTY